MLILASASPRRRDLLNQIGLHHTVVPAHIDETRHAGEHAMAYVCRLALEKARTVHALDPQTTVLAADTTVVLDGTVLNKPADLAEADRMLRSLAGRTHHVHTGIAVVTRKGEWTHVERTAVTMTPMHEDDLAAYLATGDSLDKAGAYGIQGYAGRWVEGIHGDFFNVVGLPLAATVRLLQHAAIVD
ncbi:MAG: Maf family protein [Janthinobacterium lividum]